jgi:DNA modification methylase
MLEKKIELLCGDSAFLLQLLPSGSVDAIVTDPPYGLSFMGKRWDYDVPSEEIWRECLRVLKPGGHLLAFAGTRTQHRMAVRIEDAGFEIRDMIAWVYGSGFPKSLDVSKAIDKAAGAEREVIREATPPPAGFKSGTFDNRGPNSFGNGAITAPATPEARQWQGWGTALKPALETVTFASKPYTDQQERDIIKSNLFRLEARLWLLSHASAAEKSSTSSQSEYGAACAIAQWSAEEITNTQAALCDQMDMSLFELATTTSLSIVSSWRRILAESWSDGSTYTTETKSSTTIDLKTLKFSLSQITPESIIRACSFPNGFSANATTAESHFNASLLLLQSIRTLSATENAISLEAQSCRDVGVKPNFEPVTVARKPLIGTVAENVLAHGTGALNVDGCRVGVEQTVTQAKKGMYGAGSVEKMREHGFRPYHIDNRDQPKKNNPPGRWPANLIHDGGEFLGDAARFFYCAKASKKDRGEGCEGMQRKMGPEAGGSRASEAGVQGGYGAPRENHHPTVKPTDLMRYLCRLVTPPGGVVLDPFMGSGSTGKAAVLEGFQFIGIEREAEYLEIAKARIEHAGKANRE